MIDDILGPNRVIATVTIDDPATAAPVGTALVTGGIPVVEVMLRNETGLDAIAAIRSSVPGSVVGAGTVLSVKALDQAVASGAMFAVSPGFDSEIADRAKNIGIPYIPGAVTPTEIQQCLRHDLRTIKFFPASSSGGVQAIKALSAAYSVAHIEFVATGGIDETNAFDYLALRSVRAVGMSWIADSKSIRERAWTSITNRAVLIAEGALRHGT